MSTLIAVAYDDEFKAQEIRVELLRMQKAHLLDLEDAVVARKTAKGKIKLEQLHNLTAAGAATGGFWGVLIGLLFLSPLFGFAVGAGAGAISGALADVGINDDFMRNLSNSLAPGTSALFVLVRSSTPDKVLGELEGTGGRILHTSLSHEDESRLQVVLDKVTPG